MTRRATDFTRPLQPRPILKLGVRTRPDSSRQLACGRPRCGPQAGRSFGTSDRTVCHQFCVYGGTVGLFLSDDSLSDSGARVLFAPHVSSWSARRVQSIRSGVELRETDITAVLCALQDDAEDALIDHLLLVAELPLADRVNYRYHLIRPSEVRANRRRLLNGYPSRVSPDIVVTRTATASDSTAELVLAVEVKRDAPVNYIACPAGIHRDYSNQLVCYAHSCWLSADSPSRDTIRYVWMAPATDLKPGVFPRHALNGTAFQYQSWRATREAYERQRDSLFLWKTTSLEAVACSIEEAAFDVAELIRKWGRC